MSSFALLDMRVTINASNLSAFMTSGTLNVEVEELEDTAFGDTWRSRLGGLKDYSVDFAFNTDFAASAVDVVLWPLLGTVVPVTIRPTSVATSATNPEYQGGVLVSSLIPLDGKVGDLATNKISWPGSGALVRATT